MYIYGITIGMNFEELGDIIMSPVGLTFSKLLNGNIYKDDPGTFSLNNTFNYFELGPNLDIFTKIIGKTNNSAVSYIQKYLEKYFGADYTLPKIGRNGNIQQKLNIIDTIREESSKDFSNKVNDDIIELKVNVNQYLDFIEEYLLQWEDVNQNYNAYRALKELSQGAEEMRTLGSLLRLNQGLRVSTNEIINMTSNMENIINNRLKVINQERLRQREKPISTKDRINLRSFILFENYRNNVIKEYDAIKHTFNILDVISTVPHFRGYFETACILHSALESTIGKYEAIKNIGGRLIEDLKLSSQKDRERLYKGVQRFYDTYVRDDYFLSKNIVIPIPKGMRYYEEGNRESEKPSTGKQFTRLGTKYGNATFKAIMERVVIPKIKQGILSSINSSVQSSLLQKNHFVQSLEPKIITNNVSHNTSINYAPNSTMMPRSDSERSEFILLKDAFNRLQAYTFQFPGNIEIPLTQLFYYYGLICNQGRLGESSLMSIFEDLQNQSFIQEFYNYEKEYDQQMNLKDFVNDEEVYPYILGIESGYTTRKEVFFTKDKFVTKLARKEKDISELYEDAGLYLDEEFVGNSKGFTFDSAWEGINYNLFVEGPIQNTATVTIKRNSINGKDLKVYIKNHNQIASYELDGKRINLKSPITITNEIRKSELSIEGEIIKLINGCK